MPCPSSGLSPEQGAMLLTFQTKQCREATETQRGHGWQWSHHIPPDSRRACGRSIPVTSQQSPLPTHTQQPHSSSHHLPQRDCIALHNGQNLLQDCSAAERMAGSHGWEMLIPTSTAPPATGGPQQSIPLQATPRQALLESTWLSFHSPPCPAHLMVVQKEGGTSLGFGTSSSLWERAHGVFGWHWPHGRASWHGYCYPSDGEVAFNYFSVETWLFSVNGIHHLLFVHCPCKPNHCSFIRKTCTLLQEKQYDATVKHLVTILKR